MDKCHWNETPNVIIIYNLTTPVAFRLTLGTQPYVTVFVWLKPLILSMIAPNSTSPGVGHPPTLKYLISMAPCWSIVFLSYHRKWVFHNIPLDVCNHFPPFSKSHSNKCWKETNLFALMIQMWTTNCSIHWSCSQSRWTWHCTGACFSTRTDWSARPQIKQNWP